MKNLKIENTSEIVIYLQVFYKMSHSMAVYLAYSNCEILQEGGKIYTNKGNYSSYTLAWLTKHVNAEFVYGNDAPRGGKNGRFATNTNFNSPKCIKMLNDIVIQDYKITQIKHQEIEIKNLLISNYTPSEETLKKFKRMAANESMTKTRKLAYNFSAKDLGFYSSAAMHKFINIAYPSL